MLLIVLESYLLRSNKTAQEKNWKSLHHNKNNTYTQNPFTMTENLKKKKKTWECFKKGCLKFVLSKQ